MAGLDKNTPLPTRIVLHQQSQVLEIAFSDRREFRLPFELLRVYSPSAEVRGHGPGQEVLQVGKRGVGITAIEQVGHYALQPRFSDGHETGIFSWEYLHSLGENQARLWSEYEGRLAQAGASRDPLASPVVVMRSAAAGGSTGAGVGAGAGVGTGAGVGAGTEAGAEAGAGVVPAAPAAGAATDDDAGFQSVAVTRPR